MIQFDEDKQKLELNELHEKEAEEFVKTAALNRGLQYINLASSPISLDALRLIPKEKALELGVIAFAMNDKKIGVATLNPDNPEVSHILDELKNKNYIITLFLVSKRSIERASERYSDLSTSKVSAGGAFELSNEEVTDLLGKIKGTEDIKKLIDEIISSKTGYNTTKVVEIILAGALAVGASDVHIEPEQTEVRLRFRLDGVLNDIMIFDGKTYNYIASRLKLLSGMKLNVKNDAQDGRFSIKTKDGDLEVRSSVIPGAYGESIVMRILDPKSIQVPMEELGIEPHLQKILEREIKKPNGMILTTGPTGSGKTTTLYAFLRKVHTTDTKIITVEDPVEYHIPGIVQTQTNSDEGYTFESGLRAILRQDPDIIMIGEIRDGETAEIAINAALTGHLVFSTLHTNTAAGTFPRLLDLGVNPKVVTSAINVAMAQRLVRKLCDKCKKESEPTGEDKKIIEKILNDIPIEEYKKLSSNKVYKKGDGCEQCHHTGYKGRTGLYEAILAEPGLEKVVIQNPSEAEIIAFTKKQDILNMKQDAVVKILKGITSLEEVGRVIDLN
jgi:type IV pilus assembly protein PilB